MKRELLLIALLVLASTVLWFVWQEYGYSYLRKAFHTFLSFAAIYAFFRYGVDRVAARQIKDAKTKYSLRKTVWVLSLVIFLVLFFLIWVENAQTLAVSYGLIGAGIAIALQDVFKNFVGGITIFVSGIFRVGDRIEIGEQFGDVIDIGILYTTLLEIGEWSLGDQPTGRLKIVPNGAVLTSVVDNYTKDHNFIWDVVTVPITYDSDWSRAAEIILRMVTEETAEMTKDAREQIVKIEKKYYLPRKSIEPAVHLRLDSNWIEMNVRYITAVRERRAMHSRLSRAIIEEIQRSPDITIASESYDITLKQGQKARSGDA